MWADLQPDLIVEVVRALSTAGALAACVQTCKAWRHAINAVGGVTSSGGAAETQMQIPDTFELDSPPEISQRFTPKSLP